MDAIHYLLRPVQYLSVSNMKDRFVDCSNEFSHLPWSALNQRCGRGTACRPWPGISCTGLGPWTIENKWLAEASLLGSGWKVVGRNINKQNAHQISLSGKLMSSGEHRGTLIITQKDLLLHACGEELTAWCSHSASSPCGIEVIKIMVCRTPLHMQGMYLWYQWRELVCNIGKLLLSENSMKGYEDSVLITSTMNQVFLFIGTWLENSCT